MVMYKWYIVINGKEYTHNASKAGVAVSHCIDEYDEINPRAKKMDSGLKKTVREEGTTFVDVLSHLPNYSISVRKLGTVYKGGIFK